MTGLRGFLLGVVTTATVYVAIADGYLFTLVFWLPSVACGLLVGSLARVASDADEWMRDIDRRPPRSIP